MRTQLKTESNKILTKKQKEILLLLCKGYSKNMIAEHFTVEPCTIATHFNRIYSNLGVIALGNQRCKTVILAIRKAIKLNVITIQDFIDD